MADVIVEKLSQEPIYLYIRRKITERIERGDYTSGSALPSENELAEEFGVTRLTVRNAIDSLVEQGLIRRVQGKGTYVGFPWMETGVETGGFREMISSSNAVPSVRILSKSKRLAGPYYAKLFGIDSNEVLYTLRRLNSVDGEPVSLENTVIPLSLFEGIEDVDVSVFSVYETYGMYGHKVGLVQEKLDISALSARDAGLLRVEPGSLALVFECLTYDEAGQVIEHSTSYNRGDRGGYIYQY